MQQLKTIAKTLAARLPENAQDALKRRQFARELRSGTFSSPEPEFPRLREWVRPGDLVMDVGANIGHYTAALSQAAGQAGRVIAFEPIPRTFALLTGNLATIGAQNVTLINAAVAEAPAHLSMSIPSFDTGLKNYYEARITQGDEGTGIFAITLDAFLSERPVRLIKIDAEGHEMGVLRGGERLIARDKPTLIVETGTDEPERFLLPMGYTSERLTGSPNILFTPA